MSLQDILGKTAEIRIVDFLAENFGNSYTQWEIYELTGISRNVLYKKLPEMVSKSILEIDGEVGTHRTYRLAENKIVDKLIAMIYEYNLIESEKPDIETEAIKPERPVKTQNRYFKDPDVKSDDAYMSPIIKKERSIPFEYEPDFIGDTGESTGRIELKEQYSKAVSAESA